jgi:hypothetical protein
VTVGNPPPKERLTRDEPLIIIFGVIAVVVAVYLIVRSVS